MLSNKQKHALKVMTKRAYSLKKVNEIIEGLYCGIGNHEQLEHMKKRKKVISASIVLLSWQNKINVSFVRQMKLYSDYK